MIPELTRSQCNWEGNQKGKGTDETPHHIDQYTGGSRLMLLLGPGKKPH